MKVWQFSWHLRPAYPSEHTVGNAFFKVKIRKSFLSQGWGVVEHTFVEENNRIYLVCQNVLLTLQMLDLVLDVFPLEYIPQ